MTKIKTINIYLSDQLQPDSGKWYKALSSGNIYSRKYTGVWDADKEKYFCRELTLKELKEGVVGKIEIHMNFLQAIADNFHKNANETIPFIDFDHEQGISAGPIADCKIENNALYVLPALNDLGRKSVGEKEFMYLSVGIEPHINSKTGEKVFPVMTTASLVNIPVDKDQEILELSEKSAPTGNKADNKDKNKIKSKNGGIKMDELIQAIRDLAAKIQSALESDEDGVFKAAIGAAIDNLEVTCGLATEEEEKGEGEGVKADEMKDKTPIPAAPEPGNSAKQITQMSDNPDFIALSDKNKALENEVKTLKDTLELADFRKQFVGKKITPAEEKEYFPKWQKDKAFIGSMLNKLADLGLTDRKGSGNDIDLQDDKDPATARQLWDKAVLELADTKKIDALAAAEILSKEKPQLYQMAYPKKA